MSTHLPYNEIAEGAELYGPDGEMVKVINKHKAIGCNEERLIYVFLSDVNGTRYSVAAGIGGENFYTTKPSPEQISKNQAEKKALLTETDS